MKLIKVVTIYKEEFYCKLIKKNKYYLYTDKGCIPISDIEYIATIGECL